MSLVPKASWAIQFSKHYSQQLKDDKSYYLRYVVTIILNVIAEGRSAVVIDLLKCREFQSVEEREQIMYYLFKELTKKGYYFIRNRDNMNIIRVEWHN